MLTNQKKYDTINMPETVDKFGGNLWTIICADQLLEEFHSNK